MSNPISDTIVYNATVSNTSNQAKTLSFNDFRKQNLLDHAEHYYVRVFEAKIPMMSVPFFRMFPEPTSGEDKSMKVTIGTSTVSLVPIQLNPINGDVVYIFYIQQFLDSLNLAFANAHVASSSPGNPPRMFYDFENEILNLAVDSEYYSFGVNPVPIFFNTRLMYKFTGFMNEYLGDVNKEYKISYGSYYTNYRDSGLFNIDYEAIFMPSQSKFYKDFLEFQSIIVTTRSLKLNEQTIASGDNEIKTLPILTEIPITFEDLNSSKYLTFSQVYPKWTVLNFQGPLKAIDLYAYYVGDDFSIYDLFILPGQKFNIRLEFIRKELIKKM